MHKRINTEFVSCRKYTFECRFFSNQSDSLQLLIGVIRPVIIFNGIIDLLGFIYLFNLGYVGSHCCVAFSVVASRAGRYSLVMMCGLLIAVASLVAEHRL